MCSKISQDTLKLFICIQNDLFNDSSSKRFYLCITLSHDCRYAQRDKPLKELFRSFVEASVISGAQAKITEAGHFNRLWSSFYD